VHPEVKSLDKNNNTIHAFEIMQANWLILCEFT